MSSVKNPSLDKRQSNLIKAMRFPLIVLVIIAHSIGSNKSAIDFSLDGWNIYHFISEMITNNFCKIAVCWFFVFAGYFFFINIPEEGLSWKWLSEKWERRVFTLLIPFLFWNLLAALIPLLKTFLFSKLGIPQSALGEEYFIFNKGPVYWFITGPADFPLWFMRDLMIMCLLSPLVYCTFTKVPRFIGLSVLVILFILPFETSFLKWRGYFFFSLGAFLSIKKLNILDICRKVKWPATFISIILLILATYYTPASFHEWILRLYYPFGMITFMNIIDWAINNEHLFNRLSKLSATVFFIFASHAIYILAWTNGLFRRFVGDGLAGTWLRYLLFPFVVIGACLSLYYLLSVLMPRTLAFVCGGRSKKS